MSLTSVTPKSPETLELLSDDNRTSNAANNVTQAEAIDAAMPFIQDFEQFEAKAYPDSLNGWALPKIGYGTTQYPDGTAVQEGDEITQAQAVKYLRHSLENICQPALAKIPSWSQMNKYQQVALYSFAYNLQPDFYRSRNFDSITRLCDSPQRWHDRAWITEQFVKYRKRGTQVESGLRRRRQAEAALFCQTIAITPWNPEETDGRSPLETVLAKQLMFAPEGIALEPELAKEVQRILIRLGLLEPPADGNFGPLSTGALLEFQALMTPKHPDMAEEEGFLGPQTTELLMNTAPEDLPQPELKLGNDLASRVIKYMQAEGYEVFTKPRQYNIVYVEGMNTDGSLNNDAPNHFNDVRMVIEFEQGVPKIVGIWEGTTEPGFHYTDNPISAYARTHGAARIKFGQYKAWCVGIHGNSEPHEALVQVGKLTVHRDRNRDLQRTNDKLDTGNYFGINQHYGYDMPRRDIGAASAGCLVGRTRWGHREFMEIVKQDRRYQSNQNYMFYTTIIPADDMEARFPSR